MIGLDSASRPVFVPATTANAVDVATLTAQTMAIVAVEPDGGPGPVRVAHLLPADEGRSESRAQEGKEGMRLPPGAITAQPRRRRPRRGDAEDVTADGERYRLFAPRPASLVDEDFLELIGALEAQPGVRRVRIEAP